MLAKNIFTKLSYEKLRIIKSKIIVLIVLLITTISFSEVYSSNRYTKVDNLAKVKNSLSLENYTLVLENEYFEIYTNGKDIRIKNKKSGYIWGNPDNLTGLNKIWSNIASSIIGIEYFDDKSLSYITGIDSKEEIIDNGIKWDIFSEELGIKFNLFLYLKNDHLEFYLPKDSIIEEKEFKLGSVYIMPFLGAVNEDEIPGYILLPDGAGALIRFSKEKNYSNWFEKRVYGKDYGIENLAFANNLNVNRPNDFLKEEPIIHVPVYGIVHGVNQNAFFSVINSGAEYSSIVAYPSGALSGYNWASVKFIYRQKYLQPTSRSGNGVQIAQKEKNSFDAKLSLYFLTGDDANYVGIAKKYKKLLFNNVENKEINKKIPLALEIVLNDIEKKLLGFSNLKTSSLEFLKSLNELNIENKLILIDGWQKNGAHGNKIKQNKVYNREIIEYAKNNSNIFFVNNVTKVNDLQINKGNEAGINLSQYPIYEDRDNKQLWYYRSFYTNIKLANKYLKEKFEMFNNNGINNFAVKYFGNKLYGNLHVDEKIFRDEAKRLIINTIENYSNNNLLLYSPNDYLWKYIKGFLNIPMNNSQYIYETDTVPFLQIILSGYIDYFTPYMNVGFFSRLDILKTIDFGAYPSFIITEIDNYLLRNTALADYPSTKYDDWKDTIINIYNEINSALSEFRGHYIINRIVLTDGVVKNTYDNGKSIIINYTNNDYAYNTNIIVKAESWKIINEGVNNYENEN
ncbi:DUF5696 domain-containing protein [Marinitoga sp. 38H-ov]|uniref:DUF5696 domain-containing protein n=1 Tax=Marinitoga sp. 38H-ov TaxID=1755814 RepID=UPI0016AD6CBC|nr:DUF5696 domain-containing protein [Marinitoga sp. 38H-ov]KAF2955431.1 hypothetical protein AS160_10415 [Marinitoga sp. 38H-ov]